MRSKRRNSADKISKKTYNFVKHILFITVDYLADYAYNNRKACPFLPTHTAVLLYYIIFGEKVIMKFRRFLSVFLVLLLLGSQFAVVARATGDEPEEENSRVIHIDAEAALLVDADSGAVLYQQNQDEEMSIASITKVMTALLVLEAVDRGELSLKQNITATATAVSGLPADGSNADPAIVEGEVMTVEDLMYCMMVVSANEACNILAEAVSGSVSAFVNRMNIRAEELGCTHTHFANPNGLTADEHYSCAWDVYLITREALKNEDFQGFCSATWKNIQPTNKCESTRVLHTTNALLDGWRYGGYQYSYARGVKTGSTDDASQCLVSYAVRGSRRLISVVLGAEKKPDGMGGTDIMSFSETIRLFEWGFANFTSKTVLTEDELVAEVPVALSKEAAYVTVHPAVTRDVMLPNDLDPEDLKREITLNAEVANAPIVAGQELGTITLTYGDIEYASVPLVALNDVSASHFLVAKDAVENFFAPTIIKVLTILGTIFVVAVFMLIRMYVRRRRYGKLREKRYQRHGYKGRRY